MALIKDNDGDIINVNKYNISMLKRIKKYVDEKNGNFYYFYYCLCNGSEFKCTFYTKDYANDDVKCFNAIEKLHKTMENALLEDIGQDKTIEPCNAINLKK